MTASFEERVLRGVAALLAGNPAATVALTDDQGNPAINYTAGQVGLYLDTWPEIPGGSVTLSDYPVTDDLALSDSVLGLQVTIRHADLSTVKAIASDVFNLLHGRQASMLGTVTLVSARRASGSNLGQDSNERRGRADNYYLTLHRPTTNRS